MTSSSDPPDLTAGDTGEWVTELQRLLALAGRTDDVPTGVLDEATLAALASFQAEYGLAVAEHVDATTWTYLRAVDRPADQDDTSEWHWDGTQWVSPADVVDHAESPLTSTGDTDESNWHWDGYQWQPSDTRGQDA